MLASLVLARQCPSHRRRGRPIFTSPPLPSSRLQSFPAEMVGVPRSLGCQLCVKRRVKCDQTRPACTRCTKYGATCPGYDRPLKFVAGKHQLRPRHQEGSISPVALSRAATVSGVHDQSVSTGSNNSSLHTSETLTARSLARYGAQHQGQPRIPVTMGGDRGQIVFAYLNTVNYTQTHRDLQVFDPWFKDVPRHLGHKPVLDNAMAAFSLHMLGKSNDDKNLIHHSRTIYGQSLITLQRALNDPVEWKSSETLCATMILCLFELFAGTTNANSWMKHASGVSWLMQQRGPEAHKGPWNCNMLRSFQAITIMNSIFSGDPCFLARKPWQTLLHANIPPHSQVQAAASSPPPDATTAALRALHDQYMLLLTHLPDIIHRGSSLRALKQHSLPISPSQISILMQRATHLHSQFTALFARFDTLSPAPVETSSSYPDPIYASILWYSNPWHGALRMSFWATLLVLQECLVQCGINPAEYGHRNGQLAADILRSVECVGRGVMGGYRVGYPVRVAWEVVDGKTRGWIKGFLESTEGTYAAASYGTYPK